ncbi:MAG TPA: hypothetical protein VNU26_12630, partial [Mycobacteriales bacterium]|nr:hypothetical protein [Mycobacteriales bacterium]
MDGATLGAEVLTVEDPAQDRAAGLLRAASEELIDRLRALADLTRSTGAGSLGALPGPLPTVAGGGTCSTSERRDASTSPAAAIDLFL